MDSESSTRYRIAVLHGDGIGLEIMPPTVAATDAALRASGAAPVEWLSLPFGAEAIVGYGAAVPERTLHELAAVDGWLLGPHDSASYPEPHRAVSPSGTIRKHFDLFANIRPARWLPGAQALAPGTDLVIVRENTEGFYADRNTYAGTGEYMPTADVAIATAVFTRPAVARIAGTALELAASRRKKLTIVHKANVLRMTTGMFRDVCYEVASDFPDVAVEDLHVDAITAHLVRRASDFDVIVTENMFGDILSDLTAELAGSLGTAASLNASHDHAMGQAAHGSAPDIAGQGVANPIAMIRSSGMLLEWLGTRRSDEPLVRAAGILEQAVAAVVAAGRAVTRDLGGRASTGEATAAIVAAIDEASA